MVPSTPSDVSDTVMAMLFLKLSWKWALMFGDDVAPISPCIATLILRDVIHRVYEFVFVVFWRGVESSEGSSHHQHCAHESIGVVGVAPDKFNTTIDVRCWYRCVLPAMLGDIGY